MNTVTMRRGGASLLFLLATVLPATAGAQHFPADEELEMMLRYLVEDGETPGIALGVLEPSGATRIASYGSAGPGARPTGPHSTFEIGSLTKTLTATLLADMAARGEVALGDPLEMYLPRDVTVPRGARPITLLDLATHTSALPRLPEACDPPEPGTHYGECALETIYAFLASYRLDAEPGARYDYSDLGYGLLGLALARAGGMDFPDLLRVRVLEPLGMESTGYAPEGEVGEWLVQGHARGRVVPRRQVAEAMRGAGGLHSNVEDMLRFLEANVGPPGTELERAMRTAQEVRVRRFPENTGYGFSWRTYIGPRQPPMVIHGGSTDGFHALLVFDPERRIGTVVLANDRYFRSRIGRNLLLSGPPPATPEVQVDPGLLQAYAGTYWIEDGLNVYVRLEEEGHLTYQYPGEVRSRLHAMSDDSFYLVRGALSFTFRAARDGRPGRLLIEVDERQPRFTGSGMSGRKLRNRTPHPAVVARNAWFWGGWSRGTWIVVGLLVGVSLVLILRPFWSEGRRRESRPHRLAPGRRGSVLLPFLVLLLPLPGPHAATARHLPAAEEMQLVFERAARATSTDSIHGP